MPTPKNPTLPEDLIAFAQFYSASLRICVFYGLLYVVVEGYQHLNCHDDAIERLLAKTDYVGRLRRFRNATFHYQEEQFPAKLLDFLTAKDSEHWCRDLHGAFNDFFVRILPIRETLARYRAEGSNKTTS